MKFILRFVIIWTLLCLIPFYFFGNPWDSSWSTLNFFGILISKKLALKYTLKNLTYLSIVTLANGLFYGILLRLFFYSKKSKKTVVTPQEISINEKNQYFLNEYISKQHDGFEIGLIYERQIAHLLTSDGFLVSCEGAIHRYEDQGRDLVATKEDKVIIVQAKCWSKSKRIQEKHIYQLYGTVEHYRRENKDKKVSAVFYSNTNFSERAVIAAKTLEVDLKVLDVSLHYPMVKCIKISDSHKIYLMPWDEYYDNEKVNFSNGDLYVYSVNEAVENGFKSKIR